MEFSQCSAIPLPVSQTPNTSSDQPKGNHIDRSDTTKSRWSSIFGGQGVLFGARISNISPTAAMPIDESNRDDFEAGTSDPHANGNIDCKGGIVYQSCSWQKTAALLLAEFIGLAIMSIPAAYSEMGWVGGLCATVFNAVMYQYTSLVLWKFCLRHPEARDICDIGRMILGNSVWGWWFTAVIFILNNTFVMGVHIIAGSEYLSIVTADWLTNICKPVLFGATVSLVCSLTTLPRTFNILSHLATLAAVSAFVSLLLSAILLGIQDYPAKYGPGRVETEMDGTLRPVGLPVFSPWPAPGATFASITAAFLNICYTFIGQIALPSFIAEMKEPRDFPKALWLCTIIELCVFSTIGTVLYKYTGIQYMTSPAFGGLQRGHMLIAFSFMLPTSIILGSVYASITARFIFFRIFQDSRHMYHHTTKGWLCWGGLIVIAVVGAVFDAFFGFVYWAIAWLRMRGADKRHGREARSKIGDRVLFLFNMFIIILGVVVFLGAGTYASVVSILQQFHSGSVKGTFSCVKHGS